MARILYIIAIILIISWAIGILSGFAKGYLIHSLLVIAVIVLVLKSRRKNT